MEKRRCYKLKTKLNINLSGRKDRRERKKNLESVSVVLLILQHSFQDTKTKYSDINAHFKEATNIYASSAFATSELI